MQRPEKFGEGPISSEELEEVFGFILTNEEAILVDRIGPKASSGSSIIIPKHTKEDYKTGATAGIIIQIGSKAQEAFDEKLKAAGKHFEIGGLVTFSYAAPVDPGLITDNGLPIQSGFTDSPYAGLGVLHYRDVIGYLPKERAQRFVK